MITRDQEIKTGYGEDFSFIGPAERLIFFDIETTGLRAGRAELYLIGVLRLEAGRWILSQWFSESMEDEEALLDELQSLIAEKRKEAPGRQPILVSYNGDGFDIPFISQCLRAYGRQDITKSVLSFDLYRHFRGLKSILGLRSMKLKAVEGFLGIAREDCYGGGELIQVYEEYRRLKSHGGDEERRKELLELLLLHNAEDISNLPHVCRLNSYSSLLSGGYVLDGAELVNVDKRASLDLRLSLRSGLPSEFAYEDDHYVISASGSRADLLNIAVNLYEGELKYFFADHKNYYYLPMEDRAIHKSVGAFVERSARRQATKETCYERKQGLFLPEPEIIFAPVYKSAFRSEQQYALFDKQMLTNESKLLEYASAVIRYAAAKINTKTREKMV